MPVVCVVMMPDTSATLCFTATEPKSAEILIALLKGPLKSGFQSMLQKKLYGALSTTLNQLLANVTMKIPLGSSMDLDMSMLFSPTFTTSGIEAYLRVRCKFAHRSCGIQCTLGVAACGWSAMTLLCHACFHGVACP